MSRNNITGIRRTAGEASASPARTSFSLGDRIYLRTGRFGARTLHRLGTVCLLALVAFADYLIVLFTAVSVVPNAAAMVQQGTGVTLEMRLDAVIAGWVIPVLFITAAVLVAEVYLMRALWRAAMRASRRLRDSLLRLDADPAAVPAKATRKQKTPRTGKASAQPKIAAVS